MKLYLTLYHKRRIYALTTINGKDVEYIYNSLFQNDTEYDISIDYLKKLIRKIHSDPEWAESWIQNDPIHSGRKRRLQPFERDVLLQEMEVNNSKRLTVVTKEMAQSFYQGENDPDAPSYATIRRSLIRANLSRKVLERVHILVDDDQRAEYYRELAHVRPERLCDTDGMACSKNEFFERFGWSSVGTVAEKTQLVIGGHVYNVLATYTCLGWISWEIFVDETVDSINFVAYLRGRASTAAEAYHE
jgi:hypothetical protein